MTRKHYTPKRYSMHYIYISIILVAYAFVSDMDYEDAVQGQLTYINAHKEVCCEQNVHGSNK